MRISTININGTEYIRFEGFEVNRKLTQNLKLILSVYAGIHSTAFILFSFYLFAHVVYFTNSSTTNYM